MTHSLDGISYRHCQQFKLSRGGTHDSQPGWDFMHALSAIEIEQRKHSHSRWDFMQTLSVIKIEQKRHTQLTSWMIFYTSIVSNQN